MTHISKRALSPKVTAQLFAQLAKLVSVARKADADGVLAGLLSPAERIMLAKRFATVIMLNEELPQSTIATRLDLSRSTVAHIAQQHQEGRYDSLLGVFFASKRRREETWKLIETISRGGLPPIGKGRWQWLDAHTGHYYPKTRRSR
jgi:Trp operon repressor